MNFRKNKVLQNRKKVEPNPYEEEELDIKKELTSMGDKIHPLYPVLEVVKSVLHEKNSDHLYEYIKEATHKYFDESPEINVGKYKGKKILAVYLMDKNYLKWLHSRSYLRNYECYDEIHRLFEDEPY